MIAIRMLAVPFGLLAPLLLSGEDLSKYRGFQFGMDLNTAVKQAGVQPSEARLIHQRPAVIQEVEWQPSGYGKARDADPIKDGLLSFYNGQLFRIVITYDRDKVEGMTAEDVVAAISTTYGVATRPKAEIAYHSNYAEVASVLARWEDPEYSYNLVRSGYGDSFAMVMYSKRLGALASAAINEASRRDAAEAPARALESSRKLLQDQRLVLEKARSVNSPNFRP